MLWAYDGHSNSLYLLSALHAAILRLGGRYVPNARVETISPSANQFIVRAGSQTVGAPKLLLAAGLGIPALAPSIGLTVPMKPQRGQNLITERLDQTLSLPIQGGIRQTREGGFQLGSTREYVGFDDRTTTRGIGKIARFAVDCFPYLSGVKVVRAWSALRVMPSDTLPIYDQSPDYPGAFVATCHSGVSLAAAHVYELAKHVAEGSLPVDLACFSTRRFDHQALRLADAARWRPHAGRPRPHVGAGIRRSSRPANGARLPAGAAAVVFCQRRAIGGARAVGAAIWGRRGAVAHLSAR